MNDPTEKVSSRIDTFISKDPKRSVDMWSSKKNARVHDVALELLDMPKDREIAILEFGCGNGEFCNTLLRNGFKLAGEEGGLVSVTGIDISEKAVEAAKKFWPHHEWIQGSHIANFPSFRPFDYAVVLGPLCYSLGGDKFEVLQSILDKLMSAAHHGVGYLMITDKDGRPPGPVFTRFTPEEVRARFPQCRFEVVPEIAAEFYSGHNYPDMDKFYVLW